MTGGGNLRVPEVARRTGLSMASVRRMIHLKRLPVVRIGRTVAIPEEAVEKMIQEGYTPSINEQTDVHNNKQSLTVIKV